MTDPKIVFLPRSSSLRSVELLAVVDPEPGLPPYVAAAIVVRGTNARRQIETQALPVDKLDAAPLQQLRQLLADGNAARARLTLVADARGRCGSRTWSLRGRHGVIHLNCRPSDCDTRAIDGFLARVLRPFMRAECSEPSARCADAGQDLGMTTTFLQHSNSSLRDVELLAVVDPATGVPSYIAGAVVVRGENEQGHVATEALAADVRDAEPLQQLRQMLADSGADPVRLTLVAQGDGRSSSMACTLRGFGWVHPMHLQDAGGARDTLAIEEFLAKVMQPYMQDEAAS